jgi:hypothetical protein
MISAGIDTARLGVRPGRLRQVQALLLPDLADH